MWTFPGTNGIETRQFNAKEACYWLVWNQDAEGIPRTRHATAALAREEAQRLAQLWPGKRFLVLMADSEFCVEGRIAKLFQGEGGGR